MISDINIYETPTPSERDDVRSITYACKMVIRKDDKYYSTRMMMSYDLTITKEGNTSFNGLMHANAMFIERVKEFEKNYKPDLELIDLHGVHICKEVNLNEVFK